MRRILTLIAAMFIVASAAAQQTQHVALDRLYAAISDSCVTLECTYSMYVSQTRVEGDAELMIQGNAYVMSTGSLQVYCDGAKVWTVDTSSKEVYVEPAGPISAFLDQKSTDFVFDSAGRPISASFVLQDGLKMDVKISSMTVSKIKPEDDFRPQVNFGSDWIITEL